MAPKKKQAATPDDIADEIRKIRIGVIDHFNNKYGRQEKFEALQELCRDVGVEEGSTITQCKKNLQGVFVNIVDFVNAKENGTTFKTFGSANALRNYMYGAGYGKIFPLKMAKKNPMLRALLIKVYRV